MRTVSVQFNSQRASTGANALVTISRLIDQRLTASRLRFTAIGVIAVAVLILSFNFATTKDNRTAGGLGLGSDYMAFYNAGTILNRYGADRLYDLDLQAQLYHQNLPGEGENITLPFANAPLIAVAMRPLAMLPYVWSYAAWIGIATTLFISAFTLAWKSAGLPKSIFGIALLLALSFEPFVIENLHGGQISTIGLFAISAAIFLSLKGRRFAAGCILALCIYKPTLLPLILPMLMITRQWRTLGGFAAGTIALAALSIALVGSHACLDYLHILTGYAGKTATGTGGFQTSKFIDLNSFLKLLGLPTKSIWMVLAGLGTILAKYLWTALPRTADEASEMLPFAWAATITCTLVLNLYVGVYDSILIVPAVLLTCGQIIRRTGAGRDLPNVFRGILCAAWVLPWISSFVARGTGVQVFTLALVALAAYQFSQLVANSERREQIGSLTLLFTSARKLAA